MLEVYVDRRGEAAIENMSDLLDAYPQFAERAAASALRSQAYRLLGILKASVRHGGPDGADWPSIHPATNVLRLAQAKRKNRSGWVKNYRAKWRGPKGSKQRVRDYGAWAAGQSARRAATDAGSLRPPLLRLAAGLRYHYDSGTQTVSVGFVNSSEKLLRLVRMHAEGYDTRVTPRMRRYLWALGVGLDRETRTLTAPARPLIEPVFTRERGRLPDALAASFAASLARYLSRGGMP